MRYVSLKKVKAGMVLAYTIYDSRGRILLGADTPMMDSYVKHLKELGFYGIYIRDEVSDDIEIEPAISPQLRAEGLNCIRKRDIEGCQQVAKKIVEEILERGELSLNLIDMHAYDDNTYAHSVNVAIISCTIGMGFKLSESHLNNLVLAALSHDFGKLMIPAEILNKKGRLTETEYKVIKTHPVLSFEMLKGREDISALVKNAVLFHHENVDGSGYPKGIDGSKHTLYTKILHVADVYDALVSRRPYKEPYAPREAAEYMMGSCGTLFEQASVEMLLRCVPLYPKGTDVVLSDGRIGIIYENVGIHNLRPVVKLYNGKLIDLANKVNLSLAILGDPEKEQKADEEYEKAREKMISGSKENREVQKV